MPASSGWQPEAQESLDALLEKHSDTVASVLDSLANEPLLASKPELYDAIWALRFVLSFPSVDEACDKARRALAYRAQYAPMLEACTDSGCVDYKNFGAMRRLFVSRVIEEATLHDEPVSVVRVSQCNVKELCDTWEDEEIFAFLQHNKELAHLRADAATRRTRRLVKMVTILDMKGISPLYFTAAGTRLWRIMQRSSKMDVYPQLLALTAVVNAPNWISAIWAVAKVWAPKKNLRKARMLDMAEVRLMFPPSSAVPAFLAAGE